MYILGISAYYHDSAAALIRDEEIIAAAQEERFTRKKHDASFPRNAVEYCIKEAGVPIDRLDYIAFYDRPSIKFDRICKTFLSEAPKGVKAFSIAMPLWLKGKLFLKKLLIRELNSIQHIDKQQVKSRILFAEHHQSHSASAFYPSPFDEAAILTIDGVGEWATTSLAHGSGNHIDFIKEIHFPHSLGLLYSAFTSYLGFKVNSGEYKVMGLGPYGEPKYVKLIKDNLIDIKEDGSFKLNMEFFNYTVGATMTNKRFHELFGVPPRARESSLSQVHMDIACSIQEVTEDIMIRLAKHAKKETGSRNLCMAGGVALNCVGNGKILREKIFENMWIQPAAGDAGGALGAALNVYYQELEKTRTVASKTFSDKMQGAYLGPQYSNDEVKSYLDAVGAPYHRTSSEQELLEKVAEALINGKVIGWHQGRMEFGPRALGARSILGDARDKKMQTLINLKIKYRESFRPFAPSVMRDHVGTFFELNVDSPYMLLVAPVKEAVRISMPGEQEKLFGIDRLNIPRSIIPAVTHVDYSARIQTVHKETNSRYYNLLNEFFKLTGCATIVNTSFNLRGEPIVCSPEDSYRCFMRTEMDVLAIQDFILYKEHQPQLRETHDWKEEFELD